jgi:nitrite reductase/ring-hydroxylating ferredoxin subunit
MFIRNAWYVVAWDFEVLADTILERTVLGESIVVHRKADGAPVVMENRCCHRGAPLALGRKEGDCIRCIYHGMKFDASGRCLPWTAQGGGSVSGATTVIATPAGRPPTDPAAVVLAPWAGDAVSRGVRSCFRVDCAIPADLGEGPWDVLVEGSGDGAGRVSPPA